MATTYGTAFGASNMRTTSRQTRTNPTRTSKTNGSNLRQNSLVSNPPPSVQGFNEPHGFYPAVQHFTDAITALPRDYRKHTSLLKEVDAKAWKVDERVQTLLRECFAEKPNVVLQNMPASTNASVTNIAEHAQGDAATTAPAAPADALSQISDQSSTSTAATRRQIFAELRQNLMQIMMTMDEKNHVINNANEELSRHVRRVDNVWPYIADEISEEARLGSLKHWALTDLNPPKKTAAPSTRREAAANLALLADNEVAQRSESRREAVAAKTKQRMDRAAATEGPDDGKPLKKKTSKESQRRDLDSASELPGLGITTKGKKGAKALGGAAMEKSLSAAMGGRAMSREPSQQDGNKKRKAPAGGAAVARKRVNAAQDSPKLASSPLASTFGKEAYKRSPALGTVRPVSARARQSSTQVEGSRSKPSSAQRNGGNNSASASEIKSVAAATGKTVSEVKQSMKETTNAKGDRMLEDDGTPNGAATMRGGLLLERRTSKSRLADIHDESSAANSPRPSVAALNLDRATSRGGRAGNKSSNTPTLGTFADTGADSSNGNSKDSAAAKNAKRPARQRVKYDGLHDSLSPRGLPPKRLHKKSGSIVGLQQQASSMSTGSTASRIKEDGANASGAAVENLMSATASGSATPVDERLGGISREEEDGEDQMEVDVDEEGRESVGVERERGRASTRGGGSRGLEGQRRGLQQQQLVVEEMEDDEEPEVEEEEDGDGEEEEKYCYCQTGSYGEMVACDNDACPREWFHLECIGLKSVPKSAKWYCDECKAAGFGGGLGSSGVGVGNGGGNGKGRVNGGGR